MDLPKQKTTQYLEDLLRDPITYEIFKDPVFAEDGHVYERGFIEEYLKTNSTSPITNQLMGKTLKPAYLIKHMVHKFLSENPDKAEEQYVGNLVEFNAQYTLSAIIHNQDYQKILAYKNIPLNLDWKFDISGYQTLVKYFSKHVRETRITNHIISHCVDIDIKFVKPGKQYHKSPIYYICKYGSISSILLAIRKGANLDVTFNYNQVKPIHIIAKRGETDMILTVLNQKPEILCHRDCKGNNFIHHLIESKKINFEQLNNLLSKLALKCEWPTFVNLLTEHRGSVNRTVIYNIISSYGFSEDLVTLASKLQLGPDIHQLFLKFPDHACLKLIKTQTPLSLSAKGYSQMSILQTAIRYRFYNTSLYLLKNRVCTEDLDSVGETPLHYAIRYFPQIVPKVIHYTTVFDKSKFGVTPLHLAFRFLNEDRINLVYDLCCTKDSVFDTDCTGTPPIVYALQYGKLGFVKRIIEECPNLGNVKFGDKLMTHYLALYGDNEIVNNIPSYNNLDSVDKEGFTILHHCIMKNRNVKGLLNIGFNKNTLDKWGNDYVQFTSAIMKDKPELLKMIVDWVKPNSGTVYVFKDSAKYNHSILEFYLKNGITPNEYELRTINYLI